MYVADKTDSMDVNGYNRVTDEILETDEAEVESDETHVTAVTCNECNR